MVRGHPLARVRIVGQFSSKADMDTVAALMPSATYPNLVRRVFHRSRLTDTELTNLL